MAHVCMMEPLKKSDRRCQWAKHRGNRRSFYFLWYGC